MTHNHKMSIFVFLIICIVFSGCRKSDWSTDPPSAGRIEATNKNRKKLGIREIKKNWTFYGREFGAEKWKNGILGCKTVQHNNNYENILWEADYYYTGSLVSHPDPDAGLVGEKLQIVYDYRTKLFAIVVTTDNARIKEMEYGLQETTPEGQSHGFMGRSNEETLEVAEKILKMWGLERL